VGAHEGPAGARLSVHGFTSAVIGRGPVSGGPGTGPWAQFWSHSPPSGGVRRRPRPPVRTGHGRWRPVVNGGAQYSKACEGATPPWVQIPPPPPLTCKNTALGSRQAGASCSAGLICWSQVRAACGPPAGPAAGVVPGHGMPRTTVDDPEQKHARRRSVRPAVHGWPGPSATGRIPANKRRRGFPSESRVKRGDRVVGFRHRADREARPRRSVPVPARATAFRRCCRSTGRFDGMLAGYYVRDRQR
jgi:hypothetical protein